ncbi:MAG: ABC transporter ATP-binding protein [Pseudanabaenaceae cyanobacterium SKYGB_i_bin29]|nr:ABC transporter ATP-binding protein [Pseudanabaenaceae cyanobacterium SKYG29]MDW8420972.1 ABC transporter ATP-binding protein [Pseudanabaenaceae cyanobacterium SKYGB_i_bin29]
MLQLEGIYKAFGDQQVLTNLHINVETGTVYGLLGPNGAGKTTTINIICHLLQPDRGQVWLDDTPLGSHNRHLIGVAPQQNLIYPSLTCRENLCFFGQLYGLWGKQLQDRVKTCLELVDLTDRADSVAETLSGGMQRRLSIAIALIHQPKLVILDEPTTGLDLEARYQMWSVIRHLQDTGTTLLISSHFLDEIERLCNKIGILQRGKLIAEGTLQQLRQHIPAQEIVTIQSPDEQAILDRAQALGLVSRRYGQQLALWIPDLWELKQILEYFAGIPIDAITRQPVSLEHIYLELSQGV